MAVGQARRKSAQRRGRLEGGQDMTHLGWNMHARMVYNSGSLRSIFYCHRRTFKNVGKEKEREETGYHGNLHHRRKQGSPQPTGCYNGEETRTHGRENRESQNDLHHRRQQAPPQPTACHNQFANTIYFIPNFISKALTQLFSSNAGECGGIRDRLLGLLCYILLS